MKEQALEFIQKVHLDEDLRLKVEQSGQDITAIIELAKHEGLNFTQDELMTAIRESGYSIDNELADEDLEVVVGGKANSVGCNNDGTGWPNC